MLDDHVGMNDGHSEFVACPLHGKTETKSLAPLKEENDPDAMTRTTRLDTGTARTGERMLRSC